MQTKIEFCPKCLEQLLEMGLYHISVFEHIVDYYVNYAEAITYPTHIDCYASGDAFLEEIDIRNRYSIVAQDLEKKGFIVTTEIDDGGLVYAIPRFIDYDSYDNQYLVCQNMDHDFIMD